MTDKAPERIWAWRYNDPWGNELRWFEWDGHDPSHLDTEYVRADLLDAANARIAELEAERDEARRRRDEWRNKAEGYDAVRLALREKVGAPWPPNLSRAMWAGIAADEKKRADDAENAVTTARAQALEEAAIELEVNWGHKATPEMCAAIRALP